MVARSSISTYTILPSYDPNEIQNEPMAVWFRVIPKVYVVKPEVKEENNKED